MKNKNTILLCSFVIAVAAIVTAAVLYRGPLMAALGIGADAPADVRSEDMTALFQSNKIDEDKIASYSVAWEENLHTAIEKYKEQNPDLAVADLQSEIEKANIIVEKLNTVMQLVSDANRNTIYTVCQKASSDIESAQRFINSHGSTAQTATTQPATANSPTTPATGKYVVVTGDAVRLRTGPGLGYGVYTQVNRGKTIPYISTSGEWFCINYNGRTLYVSNQFAYIAGSTPSSTAQSHESNTNNSSSTAKSLENSAKSPAASGSYVVINANGVRLRTGPSESYGVYTKLNKGARLPYVGTSGEWYSVSYNGRTLYVSTQYSNIN